MHRIVLTLAILIGACGTSTSSGGADSDVTVTDVQIADAADIGSADGLSDVHDVQTSEGPMDSQDGQGTDATVDIADVPDTGPTDTGPSEDIHTDGGSALADLCASTGGTVYTGKCCSSASDFPDECGIGGCTCAPQYLKDIQRCDCGAGKCFKQATGCP